MERDLQQKIREASSRPDAEDVDFNDLLGLIDQHYDQMEASITQSLTSRLLAPSRAIDLIFESVAYALLSVGEDGRVRNCNRSCAKLFGASRKSLLGLRVDELLPATGGPPFADFVDRRLADAGDSDNACGEIDAVRRDGSSFAAEINLSELNAGGDRVFIVGLEDCSLYRAASKTERENEQRYLALVRDAPEAVLVIDVNGDRIVDANDPACMLFNLSRARLLSAGPTAICAPSQENASHSAHGLRPYIEKALAGQHPVFEWQHRDSTGRVFPCEVRMSRLPAGDRDLVRASIEDIAERKRNEDFANAQNCILEMIAGRSEFTKTLKSICYSIERLGDGMRVAIMQLDVKRQVLQLEQAPSLPESFKLALDFVRVAEDGRASGAAVFANRERIVADIAADPAWEGHQELAREHGVRGAWSFPLHGAVGRIIGALDVYLDRPRMPSSDELDKVGQFAKLAGIAINRQIDEEQLRSSESRYRGLFENVVDGVYIATREGEIITVNPALVEMLGYDSVEDLKRAGPTSALYVNPVDRERVFARLEAYGVVKNFEFRLRRKDGSEIVVLENSRAISDADGKVVASEGTMTDITERKRAETRVFEEKERAQVTLQSIGDGVVTTDANGVVDYINPVAEHLTGWDLRSACGTPIADMMKIVHADTRAAVQHPVPRCLGEGRVITLADNSVLLNRDGVEIPIQDSAAPIRDRMGNLIGAVMVFHEVGSESRLFRQLSYQASHDAVTGLINRREFENRLSTALGDSHANPSNSHALLYLDLDQFKVVNDTFGHSAGDELLRLVTEIVRGSTRSTDTVARLGGDEFGVLLERCSAEHAMEVAETIRSEIEAFRFNWQQALTNVRCSIGVIMVNHASHDVASVMSSADVACYTAKDKGRNRIHLYEDSDASVRHEEMKWVSRITSAVDDNRLELFYQPIIPIGDNDDERGHYELLLRMRDENGEIVNPGQFIPAAERYNLMSTLDRWVIHEALSQLADRSPADGEAHFTLAINLSGNSLSEDRFLEDVIHELEQQQLPHGAICFEITETAAISDLSRVVHFMQTLREMGCLFSLDDFGSGLSSFNYLKNLPVDFLKIDGQFIRNVTGDAVDESMVKAICDVGHAMGIQTIAEQVESCEVLDKLSELGIGYAQGYYIAPPSSVQSFVPWADTGEMPQLA